MKDILVKIKNLQRYRNPDFLTEYEKGINEQKKTTFEFFKQCAELGNVACIMEVGIRIWKGVGVREDVSEAIIWLEKARELREPQANYCLGLIYTEEPEIEIDLELAFKLFKEGAELGNVDCMEQLGKAYYFALGVKKDVLKSREWSEKAMNLGNMEACSFLGHTYWEEDIDGKGRDTAVAYFVKYAEETKNAHSMFWLAQYFLEKQGEENKEKGLHWLKKAADLGSKKARKKLKKLFPKNQ